MVANNRGIVNGLLSSDGWGAIGKGVAHGFVNFVDSAGRAPAVARGDAATLSLTPSERASARNTLLAIPAFFQKELDALSVIGLASVGGANTLYPEGISFNNKIPSHLNGPDGFSQKAGISGTHNLDEFMQAAARKNVKIVNQTPGVARGTSNIEYQIPSLDSAGGVARDAAGSPMFKNQLFTKKQSMTRQFIQMPQYLSLDNRPQPMGINLRSRVVRKHITQRLGEYRSEFISIGILALSPTFTRDRSLEIMKNQLFKNIEFKDDAHWVVKEFFNSIYQQDKFLWALPLLVGKKGCGVNEEFCFFPDMNDPDPVYHFTGVTFGTIDDEVIVSEDQCNTYLKEACDRYLEDNPEDRDLVMHALAESRSRN